MSLESITFYWLKCDKCGRECGRYGRYGLREKLGVIAEAEGWSLFGKHDPFFETYCPDCKPAEETKGKVETDGLSN